MRSEAGRLGRRLVAAGTVGRPPELRRHAVKRLSRLAMSTGDRRRGPRWFGELMDLAPDYLVYASDYATLGELQLDAGDREQARETWRRRPTIYPRNPSSSAAPEHFGESERWPSRGSRRCPSGRSARSGFRCARR